MFEIKDALLRLVKAGTKIEKLRETYVQNGLNDDPLFEISGDIQDAIYHLIGEETDTFEDSVTALVMSVPFVSDERKVKMLMFEYKKNHPEQPKPNLCTTAEIFRMFNENGGYMTPEGDWS